MACSRLYLRTVTTFNATAPVSDIPRPTSLPPGTCLALHVPSQWPRAPCGPKCPREETTSKRHVGTPTNVSGDSSPSPLPGRSICMFKRARRPSQTCFLYALPCETCGPRRQCGRGHKYVCFGRDGRGDHGRSIGGPPPDVVVIVPASISSKTYVLRNNP